MIYFSGLNQIPVIIFDLYDLSQGMFFKVAVHQMKF